MLNYGMNGVTYVLAVLIACLMITVCMADVEDCSAQIIVSVDEYHLDTSRHFLIVDDLLYAAINIRLDDEDSDNYEWITRVYCISSVKNIKWYIDVPNTLADPVKYMDGIVLVTDGADESMFRICYINSKGKVLWKYEMDNGISFQPIQMRDNIIVIDTNGVVWEFNEDGFVNKRMHIEEGLAGTNIARYDDSRVIVTSGNLVYFIDIVEGLKWKKDMKKDSDMIEYDNDYTNVTRYPATVFGDKILVANALGIVFVMNETGEIIETERYDLGAMGCEIVTYNDNILLLSNDILILDENMNLIKRVENKRRDSDIYITDNGWILYSIRRGIVKAYNITSSKTRSYRVCNGEGMISMPIIFNDELYAYSIGGNVYAAEVPEC